MIWCVWEDKRIKYYVKWSNLIQMKYINGCSLFIWNIKLAELAKHSLSFEWCIIFINNCDLHTETGQQNSYRKLCRFFMLGKLSYRNRKTSSRHAKIDSSSFVSTILFTPLLDWDGYLRWDFPTLLTIESRLVHWVPQANFNFITKHTSFCVTDFVSYEIKRWTH